MAVERIQLPHEGIATEKSTRALIENLPRLEEAIAEGRIMNSWLTSIRFTLSSAYESERDGKWKRFSRPDDRGQEFRHWCEAGDTIPYGLHHVGSIPKKIAAFRRSIIGETYPSTEQVLEFAIQMYERWDPVLKVLNDLKAVVVKGREPKLDRQTDPRTLDHTGTCTCCARNVKLKDDKIVDHGFVIQFSERAGTCFGVGFQPVEMSPEGLIAFRDMMTGKRTGKQNYLERLEANQVESISVPGRRQATVYKVGDPQFERIRRYEIDSVKGDIGHLNFLIKSFTAQIDEWKPKLLPDGATHPAMDATEEDAPSAPGPR